MRLAHARACDHLYYFKPRQPSSAFTLWSMSFAAASSSGRQLIETIRPGDAVWIPSRENHWHGTMADPSMTHIAISEALDGTVVDWLPQISDVQDATPAPAPPR